MSNTGSTRGHGGSHRGRDFRRSSNNQALPDAAVSVFHSQRTSSVGSSRRRRGFQPDEVNKNKQKLGPVDLSTTQGGDNAQNLTAIDHHPTVSAINDKPASTITQTPTELLAPHRRTQYKDKNPNHQSLIHTQVATMDASRPELDLVPLRGVPKPVESEISSIQIITERKPSCWSVASPSEAPPTEWNSAAANIDRPVKPTLPIYRFPRPEHNAERENSVTSFSRQQTKLKTQTTGSMSKGQKFREMNGSSRLEAPEKDDVSATALVASREDLDGHMTDSLHHRFQQLQHTGQLDAEQASKVKAIQDEVLGEVSSPPGKQSGAPLPHLRVQSVRPRPSNPEKSVLPHLKSSAGPSTTTASKSKARDEDVEPGKHKISTMQDNKVPPHLQGLSAAKIRETKDLLSVTTPPPASQNKDDNFRPTIDMDEEIAATQPVLDIDEEVVAGLHAETSGTFPVAQPTDGTTQETNEQVIYVPSHTKASASRLKASAAEAESEDTNKDAKLRAGQYGNRNHSTNTRSNDFKVGPHAGPLQDVSSKRRNASLASASRTGAVPNGAGSSVKKGKRPAKEAEMVEYTSELVGWDGKMNPPPVGDEWNRRRPFNPHSNERHALIEAWREDQAADLEEKNRVVVDTASADFKTGEGLAVGIANVLSPIDKMDHETHAPNDDFTQARRHQNAAEAMNNYKAKIDAKPKRIPSGIAGMTKEEKRSLRRALKEEERTMVIPPNPHAPAANIYVRPAEFRDMSQVMNIYNNDVRRTSLVLHLDPVDELYWRGRLQEAEDERNPFAVAIHMGEKACRNQGDIIRKKQENVVGFAVAADFGSKNTMYHSSVELELMVHPSFYRQGIGRTLLDRILAALSPDHKLLECAPFLSHNHLGYWMSGGSRQAKTIMVNLLYFDGTEDSVTWRKQWLAKYDFQHVGTLPHVGFKGGKLVNMCQLLLNTSVRLG